MHTRRNQFDAAILLAAGLSVAAAALAVALASLTTVPQAPAVLSVMVVAFCASWAFTGRIASRPVSAPTRPTDRARVIPVPVGVAAPQRRAA